MPVEFAIWRLGAEGRKLVPTPMPSEAELESLIAGDVSVLGLDVLLIGRQVMTAYGKRIDLLGIDSEGDLHVIELKRDRTPREVVAQALDYGSWVKSLDFDAVATISAEFAGGTRLEELFADRFGTSIPEAINQDHHLVVVASELDAGTERIVGYLSSLGVPVNVVFFRHFVDEGRSYLVRSWLIAPSEAEVNVKSGVKRSKELWNGTDFYVSFGEPRRDWEDARRFGFISGGGKRWYWRTLEQLDPGHGVFVCIPGTGYVGIGEVVTPAVPINDFRVTVDGAEVPLLSAPGFRSTDMGEFADDPERSERVVAVKWLKTVSRDQAIWEKGMFANQNTACALRSSFTRERVLEALGLSE
jgi:hypothetical protein